MQSPAAIILYSLPLGAGEREEYQGCGGGRCGSQAELSGYFPLTLCFPVVCVSAACPRGFYRHSPETKRCLKCPPNSSSSATGATACPCNLGFYRAPTESQSVACTRESGLGEESKGTWRRGRVSRREEGGDPDAERRLWRGRCWCCGEGNALWGGERGRS